MESAKQDLFALLENSYPMNRKEVYRYWNRRGVEVANEQRTVPMHPLYAWKRQIIYDLVWASLPLKGVVLKCDLWNEGLLDDSWFDLRELSHRNDLLLVGVDVSRTICRATQQRTSNLFVICADLNALPFRSSQFDLVLDLSTLDHIPPEQMSNILCQIRYVVKGRFITIFHQERRVQLIHALYVHFWQYLKHVQWTFHVKYFFNVDWMRQGLTRLGFTIIRERPLNIGGWCPLTRFICKVWPGFTRCMDGIEQTQFRGLRWLSEYWLFVTERKEVK